MEEILDKIDMKSKDYEGKEVFVERGGFSEGVWKNLQTYIKT
jgi:hypothetical protein